ncbi:hypothetical protein BD324DRAFT_347728 [Kockovaella imperatae]|uniref:Uncharacterized protein n=1 Tax=Kockovaella imperatae TaxID=4999 RepID=A0A1Y1UJR6_9TREE|nr:hypothetical protein BD324DRAFT_347728 [Kockovaella imperatae]ORX38293.1 hypothetical protein BD324DRAFT_347728 [Kockovaella imperatae]
MMEAAEIVSNEAGPSNAADRSTQHGSKAKRRKLAPPGLPRTQPFLGPDGTFVVGGSTGPTAPLKPLQGVKVRRTDSTRPGYGRQVVFVTRKVSLGALMGRCRGLLVDEEYKCITLHAMSAAIPHALILLHSLLDLLPFSQRALWYEIRTGSTECVDEVEEEMTIGAIEAAPSTLEKRVKSTIQIDLHVGSRPTPPSSDPASKKRTGRNRPGKQARQSLRKGTRSEQDEEALVNSRAIHDQDMSEEEEEEEVEHK